MLAFTVIGTQCLGGLVGLLEETSGHATVMYLVGNLKVARCNFPVGRKSSTAWRCDLTNPMASEVSGQLTHPLHCPLCSVPQKAKSHGLNSKVICFQYGASGNFQ